MQPIETMKKIAILLFIIISTEAVSQVRIQFNNKTGSDVESLQYGKRLLGKLAIDSSVVFFVDKLTTESLFPILDTVSLKIDGNIILQYKYVKKCVSFDIGKMESGTLAYDLSLNCEEKNKCVVLLKFKN